VLIICILLLFVCYCLVHIQTKNRLFGNYRVFTAIYQWRMRKSSRNLCRENILSNTWFLTVQSLDWMIVG
jgi:hypothetical protein